MGQYDTETMRHLLHEVFNFTTEDLQANQAGVISSRQKEMMRRAHLVIPSVFIGTLLAVFILAAVIVMVVLRPPESMLAVFWIVFVLLLGLLGALSMALLRTWLALLPELKVGRVVRLAGSAHLQRDDKNVVYKVHLGDRTFQISQAKLEYLKDDEPYVIYTLPTKDVILSIEPQDVLSD
jgi:hypothetical protein